MDDCETLEECKTFESDDQIHYRFRDTNEFKSFLTSGVCKWALEHGNGVMVLCYFYEPLKYVSSEEEEEEEEKGKGKERE